MMNAHPGDFADILDRMQRQREHAARRLLVADDAGEHQWDKRPGELEATRGIGGAAVVGDAAPLVIGARHDGGGWQVVLLLGSAERGASKVIAPEAARKLADELREMADICDGKRW